MRWEQVKIYKFTIHLETFKSKYLWYWQILYCSRHKCNNYINSLHLLVKFLPGLNSVFFKPEGNKSHTACIDVLILSELPPLSPWSRSLKITNRLDIYVLQLSTHCLVVTTNLAYSLGDMRLYVMYIDIYAQGVLVF